MGTRHRFPFCLTATLIVGLWGPAYAQSQHRALLDLAEGTYQQYRQQLAPLQRQSMQVLLETLASRMDQDPEGQLSMAYMAMVTGGTDPKAQAVVAAWAVQEAPGSTCLVNNLAYALSLLEDYPNAIAAYQYALEIDPESLESLVNLGNVYLDQGQDEDAKAAYERAIGLDPKHDKAWEGLYGYYMKKKNLSKAMEIIAKIKPGGFLLRGRMELQERLDRQPEEKKLENVDEDDSLDAMDKKIDAIAKTKPLTLAPIVEAIDPKMAKKIRDAMENWNVPHRLPDTPWPVDFSSAKAYYVTSKGYAGLDRVPEAAMQMNIDPALIEKAQQIANMPDAPKQPVLDRYVQNAHAIAQRMQAMNLNDPSQVQKAMAMAQALSQGPFGMQMPTIPAQVPAAAPPGVASMERLGAKEQNGTVTTSNYNNYTLHKDNFQKYILRIEKEFGKQKDGLGLEFGEEMAALQGRQYSCRKGPGCPACIKERNKLRDKYTQRFGNMLEGYYQRHVKPAIEKMQHTEALYIKNIGNKSLKNRQGEEMKARLNGLLNAFAEAEAPIDDYEPEDSAAAKQLEQQIAKLKASAPKAGQAFPQMKTYGEEQRSLLEKVYEDTKFESTWGLAKITYENAELTLGLNDPVHDKYMDLGVSLKDFSASLTEGEGWEVGFTVAQGAKGAALGKAGAKASVGWSGRKPGRKTTLYFDDSLSAVDAQVTQTPGSEGFSVGAEAAEVGIEGGMKIESTAEGTSQLVSSLKASYKNLSVWEKQYK
ncbi:MAG: tetratricopeptide repeat protein, partial [Proteobacteria bacterium]|nr:tetratricopeptide repeat protein [Pseudomonadota bacterium]